MIYHTQFLLVNSTDVTVLVNMSRTGTEFSSKSKLQILTIRDY